jgi:uncharacterized protein
VRRALLGLLLLVVLCPTAWADDLPAADGFIVDAAQVIPAAAEDRLEAELQDYSDRTTNQIGVAVVQTIGDRSIEDYSRDLFNSWGVGQADKDNGVLLVIAVRDHRTRIEVGDGLTSEVSEGDAAKLLAELTPFARRGDFAGGVEHTERGIRTLLGDDVDLAAVPSPADDSADFGGGTAQDAPPDGVGPSGGPLSDPGGISGGTVLAFLAPLALIAFALTRGSMRRGYGGFGGYGRSRGLGSALLLGSLLNQGRTSSSGSSGGSSGGGGSWGGGGGGSWGGGGFGGGMSGGGGASGGW